MVDNNSKCQCIKYTIIPPSIIGIGYTVIYNDLITNLYVITPVSFFIGMLLIYLCPPIALSLFKRPVYYEDLVDKIHGKQIQIYQTFFFIFNSICTSLLLALFMDYIIFKYNHTSLNYFEIIGVIGGIFGLFKKWQLICGSILMKLMILCKRHKLMEDSYELELTTLDIV
tara:strand:- start:665 stop:1174 length:510 start_codon:yes stop_codon:yes gene_type:complete